MGLHIGETRNLLIKTNSKNYFYVNRMSILLLNELRASHVIHFQKFI